MNSTESQKATPRYLTYGLAAEFLNKLGVPIAETSLRRMVSQKRVPFIKLDKRGVFDPDRLIAWLNDRAVEPR